MRYWQMRYSFYVKRWEMISSAIMEKWWYARCVLIIFFLTSEAWSHFYSEMENIGDELLTKEESRICSVSKAVGFLTIVLLGLLLLLPWLCCCSCCSLWVLPHCCQLNSPLSLEDDLQTLYGGETILLFFMHFCVLCKNNFCRREYHIYFFYQKTETKY